jgi:hypothetical protein
VQALNMPIEMISFAATDGELRPLRFRYEDSQHKLHTVHIHEVMVSKELNYVGVQSYLYVCRAFIKEKEILFELRYTIKNHRWVLFRMLN